MAGWPRTRRFLRFALVVLIALLVAGALYQTFSVRSEAARFPAPGTLIDIGGRRLHLICLGEGQPVVIFESSAFGSALSASVARAEVARHTRVCSYDRVGMGWSDAGPSEISIGALVSDLELLLERAGVPPPYILVPASIGGLTSELFARRHPDQVAGLVFLDAANSVGLEQQAPRISTAITLAACVPKTAARFGLLRLIDPFGFRREGTEGAARSAARLYRPEPMATLCGLVRGAAASLQQFREAPPLARDVPLTVLVAETAERLIPPGLGFAASSVADRLTSQQAFAARSSRGTWRIVAGSDHLIGSSQPGAVAAAVMDMIGRMPGRLTVKDMKDVK